MNRTFQAGKNRSGIEKSFMTNWLFYFYCKWLRFLPGNMVEMFYLIHHRYTGLPDTTNHEGHGKTSSWILMRFLTVWMFPKTQQTWSSYTFQFSIFLSLRFFLSSRSNLTFSKIIAKTVRSKILKVTGRNKTGRDVFVRSS